MWKGGGGGGVVLGGGGEAGGGGEGGGGAGREHPSSIDLKIQARAYLNKNIQVRVISSRASREYNPPLPNTTGCEEGPRPGNPSNQIYLHGARGGDKGRRVRWRRGGLVMLTEL